MNWFLQLSIDIGTEVKYQNKMLDDMVSFTLEYAGPLAATAKKKKKQQHLVLSEVGRELFLPALCVVLCCGLTYWWEVTKKPLKTKEFE